MGCREETEAHAVQTLRGLECRMTVLFARICLDSDSLDEELFASCSADKTKRQSRSSLDRLLARHHVFGALC